MQFGMIFALVVLFPAVLAVPGKDSLASSLADCFTSYPSLRQLCEIPSMPSMPTLDELVGNDQIIDDARAQEMMASAARSFEPNANQEQVETNAPNEMRIVLPEPPAGYEDHFFEPWRVPETPPSHRAVITTGLGTSHAPGGNDSPRTLVDSPKMEQLNRAEKQQASRETSSERQSSEEMDDSEETSPDSKSESEHAQSEKSQGAYNLRQRKRRRPTHSSEIEEEELSDLHESSDKSERQGVFKDKDSWIACRMFGPIMYRKHFAISEFGDRGAQSLAQKFFDDLKYLKFRADNECVKLNLKEQIPDTEDLISMARQFKKDFDVLFNPERFKSNLPNVEFKRDRWVSSRRTKRRGRPSWNSFSVLDYGFDEAKRLAEDHQLSVHKSKE